MLSCLFIADLWSSIGKGLASWLSCMSCLLVFSLLTERTIVYLGLVHTSANISILLSISCYHKTYNYLLLWTVSKKYFLLTIPRRRFFCGSFLLFMFPICQTMSLSLSHLYPGSGVVLDCIDSWSLHPYLLCHFPMWCPGSGVVLDCIDYWSWPSYLLLDVHRRFDVLILPHF